MLLPFHSYLSSPFLSPYSAMKMMEVGEIFMGYDCLNVMQNCGEKFESQDGEVKVPECR